MKKYLLSLSVAVFALCSLSMFAEDLKEGFYDPANGLKDCELKGTLKELIRDHTVIGYGDGSWEVFYYADQDENGYCMDMYCDDWKKFGAPGSAVSGCNVEHSFAKSWWGGAKNDAYKDCYHLNPSNSTANSARSNYPLGNVTNLVKTVGSLKIGTQHHDALNVDFNIWEPKDEYKGDFARAYFYMATCYGKDKHGNYDPTVCSAYQGWRLDNRDVGSKFAMQNDNYLEFQPWEQEVLIQWHRQDPVSVKEIKRADAVSNFQHNRNPYIDYPYLAEYIWGEKNGQTVDMSKLMPSTDPDFIPGVSNGWRGEDIPPTPPGPVIKHGVTWFVCGVETQVDSIIENSMIRTLPDEPASCSEESPVFMGWTTAPIDGYLDDEPAILYRHAEQMPVVTADVSYYAVFAHETIVEGATVPTDVTFDFTDMGLKDKGVISAPFEKEEVTITFDKAGAGTAPTYYTGAVRLYAKGTMTVTANAITQIDFTFGASDKSNPITANVGTFVSPTWTGEADEVVFKVGDTSGHRKFAGMKVSMNGSGTSHSCERYITDFQSPTEISNLQCPMSNVKLLINNQLYILVGDQLFNLQGQRVQ